MEIRRYRRVRGTPGTIPGYDTRVGSVVARRGTARTVPCGVMNESTDALRIALRDLWR